MLTTYLSQDMPANEQSHIKVYISKTLYNYQLRSGARDLAVGFHAQFPTHWGVAAGAIGIVWGAGQVCSLALAHLSHSLVPAFDHLRKNYVIVLSAFVAMCLRLERPAFLTSTIGTLVVQHAKPQYLTKSQLELERRSSIARRIKFLAVCQGPCVVDRYLLTLFGEAAAITRRHCLHLDTHSGGCTLQSANLACAC